ncbi:MAG: hypothetical protein R3A10_17465 [Caldilineaceae bacterium]
MTPAVVSRSNMHPATSSSPTSSSTAPAKRAQSFFDDPLVSTDGLVVHASVADPVTAPIERHCYAAVQATGARVHMGATFVTIEGRSFGTKAEPRYLPLCVGHGHHRHDHHARGAARLRSGDELRRHGPRDRLRCVAGEEGHHRGEVDQTLLHNADVAKDAVANAVAALADAGPLCAGWLANAIITNKSMVDSAVVREKVSLIAGKYFD